MTVTRRTRHALARHEDHDLLSPDAALVAALEEAVPGAVAARASDRLGFAHDASHYLLVPQAVVTPRDAGQVAGLLRLSAARGVPLTFRSGGTSLSARPPTPASWSTPAGTSGASRCWTTAPGYACSRAPRSAP